MGFWQRWFGKSEAQEDMAHAEGHPAASAKQEEAQLRAALRHLLQQRQVLEQRGCFSDRELEEKDRELDQLDRHIKALKTQQFRLRTQSRTLG